MTQQRIFAYTLVDITSSGSVRIRDANTLEYHQMQNLNVLLQTIGLRTQPLDHAVKIEDRDLSNYHFDKRYTGSARVWRLAFDIQHARVFNDGENDFGLLNNDAHGVAITTDLNETVDFPVNIFDTKQCVNLYFESE